MTKDPRLPLSLGVKIRRPWPATDVVPNIARNPPPLAVIDHFADADTALHQLTGRPLRGFAVVVRNGDPAPPRDVRDKRSFKPWRTLMYLLHLAGHGI